MDSRLIGINDFTAVNDLESSKYLLLNKFKLCEIELNDSRLYPTYQMLINIYSQLTDILENHNRIFGKEYTDVINEQEFTEKQMLINAELEKSFDLMHWAFAHMNRLLENGRAIYDFVDENISIEAIGISSDHNLQGYFILPDNRERLLRIMKYERNLYKILKTREIGSRQLGLITIPNEVLKNHMISDDILNQIIYMLDTGLDFSYTQTILPVAKRKFLSYLEANQLRLS
ncbi:MAG TPA: hypothetical protein PKA39_12570 [Ignavibacteria bacterium]|nr:hypothetical protein [Ignavibacteria bacterium]